MIRSPSATQLRRTTPPKETNDDDGFVVHRSRGITTLSSMNEPLMPARLRQAKEKSNNDSKADERGKRILFFFFFEVLCEVCFFCTIFVNNFAF